MNSATQGWLRLGCCCLVFMMSSCSFSQAQSPNAAEYRSIRSPYPTVTPTPFLADLGNPSTENAAVADEPAVNEPAPPTPAPELASTVAPAVAEPVAELPVVPISEPTLAPSRLVVSSPLVNVRAGPGTEYPVLTIVERGQEYDIIGKNTTGDWWRFCCVNDEPAWVIDELVEAGGAVDGVPISDAVAQVPPTPTSPPIAVAPVAVAPPPTAVPAAPAPTEPPPVPSFAFELKNAEQFPEDKLVRIFLYVFDSEQSLGGYSVRVKKDGGELPVTPTSIGGQPSLTWPIADSRQRFQNMKVEFPGVSGAGIWEVELVDGARNVVGPPATFTLGGNDQSQELYVRYKKL